ncbi:tadE-like family protein [Pseudomonas fluorescens]|uniref:TadE-like family protein n=1 Tax=Pseudomonas fluorescens TaxID=294 RepID=A0A0P8X1Q8_PSEFL|nr:TadE/TadG family type IV pilus assembly protein [Pseudomonas fluorescens]KPU59678.1 tadE-like family protein [Pseudomonas fluorescens]
MKASLPHKQKGAAAIEFALVLIIFFGVFYGIISYSLPGIGQVPNLPATLTASASLQF